MRFSARPCMEVVKRDQKQARLDAFFHASDELRSKVYSNALPRPWRAVARSTESPVINALTAAVKRYDGEPLYVMVLLAGGLTSPGQTCVFASIGRHKIEVRRTVDARLIDAHEMLVLSDHTSWIGDTMRRDPLQRDSYECYSLECLTIARLSSISFERLWAASRPATKSGPQTVTLSENRIPDPLLPALTNETSADSATGPEAGNRH